jgi:hypothetical protein
MKALTVWQPWASLIMIGAKPNEFRKWDYRLMQPKVYGQRIVIHAGQRPVRPAEVQGLLDLCRKGHGTLVNAIAIPLLERIMAAHKCKGVVETSAALGTVTIGASVKVGRFEPDSDRVSHHLYAWPMIDPVPFKAPVPCNGMQGFWNYEGEVDHGPGLAHVPAAVPFSLVGDDPGRDGDREAR